VALANGDLLSVARPPRHRSHRPCARVQGCRHPTYCGSALRSCSQVRVQGLNDMAFTGHPHRGRRRPAAHAPPPAAPGAVHLRRPVCCRALPTVTRVILCHE
jgi:hypothetical protein